MSCTRVGNEGLKGPSSWVPSTASGGSAVVPGQVVRDMVPVSVGGVLSNQNATQATVGTSRVPYYTTCACTNLRLVYPGWYVNTNVDTAFPNVVTINASIEVAGTIYRATFNAQISGSMQGGALTSDPLALNLPAGQLFYVRTFVSTTGWYPGRYGNPGVGGQGGWTVTTDLTAPGSAAIADATTFTPMPAPAEIIGLPTATVYPPTAVLYGDSIAYGQGDGIGNGMGINTVTTQLGGGGYLARGLRTAGAGVINCGVQGDTLGNFVTPNASLRLQFISQGRTCIFEYARNDVSNLVPLATIQANMITAWQYANKSYDAIFQTVITPRPTSTDGFLTLVNQTINTGMEAIRVPLNNWLRAGAPIVNGAAVAIGTAGALIAGVSTAHPLTGIIDPTLFVESAVNSGLWNAAVNTRTVNDGVTVVGSTLTSATANWTAADLGLTVVIPGAGAAGALYIGTIGRIFSTTAVSVLPAMGTVIAAGATINTSNTFTQDGTHPSYYAANAAAASIIPVASLLK